MCIYDPLSIALGIEPSSNFDYHQNFNISDSTIIRTPGFEGMKHTDETKDKISKTLSLKLKGKKSPWSANNLKDHHIYKCSWLITNPDNETFTIENLAEYCRKNGLSKGTLSHYGHSKGHHAKKLGDSRIHPNTQSNS